MAYYDALRAVWPATGTTAEKIAAVNAMVVAGVQDIPWSRIRDILMNDFDWGALVQVVQTPVGSALPAGATQTVAIQAAAISIRECCLYGGMLKSSDNTVWTALTTAANRLTAANVAAISSASANAVVALRAMSTPWWQVNGYPNPFNEYDAVGAGLS